MAGTDHTGATSYEKRDVTVRPVAIVTVSILVASFLVMIPIRLLFLYLHGREQAHQTAPVSVTRAQVAEEVPEPRLEPIIGKTLADVRQREREKLTTYGWVDKSAQVVRIPIERAIELTAQAGLPSRAGAEPYRRFPPTNRGTEGAGGSDSHAVAPIAAPQVGHE
jgi:hypothetical protein